MLNCQRRNTTKIRYQIYLALQFKSLTSNAKAAGLSKRTPFKPDSTVREGMRTN